jgi:hypothetical protein
VLTGNVTAATIGRFPLGEFVTTWNNQRQPIAPTHTIGTSGADLGRLIRPAVTVSVGGTTTTYGSLTSALDSITTAGTYIVTLNANQTLAPRTITTSGADITLVSSASGISGERTIQLSSNGTLFTVDNGVTLRLGNNITLVGRNAAQHGANNTASLVMVETGGALFLNDGAKITGNTASSSSVWGVGVNVEQDGFFTMSGGEISGNTDVSVGGLGSGGAGVSVRGGTFNMSGGIITKNSTASTSGGAVNVIMGTFNMSGGEITENTTSEDSARTTVGAVNVNFVGTFNMTGGSITGNTHRTVAADVYVAFVAGSGAGILTLNNNAQIGALRLSNNSLINIGNSFGNSPTSSVSSLNLLGASSAWTNMQVLQGADGRTLTAADVAKFTLGDFISNTGVTQPISNTHTIGTSAPNLGRLIQHPSAGFNITFNPVDNSPLVNDANGQPVTSINIYRANNDPVNRPRTVTLTVNNATGNVTGFEWWHNNTLLSETNTVTLDASDLRYNITGEHFLTLEAFVGGRPYNRTITFTVEP